MKIKICIAYFRKLRKSVFLPLDAIHPFNSTQNFIIGYTLDFRGIFERAHVTPYFIGTRLKPLFLN